MIAPSARQPCRYAASVFEKQWRKWLHDGFIAGSQFAPRAVTLTAGWTGSVASTPAATGVEINFKRDGSVYDGRFANNGWLQELPKPVTKLTWDNAALIAPRTAERLGVRNGDLLDGEPGRPDDRGRRRGSTRATPRRRSPSASAAAAAAPAGSAPASASTPTRCAAATAPWFAQRRRRQSRRPAISS